MPYDSVSELPDYIKKKYSTKQQRKWMNVWNSAYKRCMSKGGGSKKCEEFAFRNANGALKSQNNEEEDEPKFTLTTTGWRYVL